MKKRKRIQMKCFISYLRDKTKNILNRGCRFSLLAVMVMTAFFVSPNAYAAPSSSPKFTTGLADSAGYYMEVYSNGTWKDLKTPQHWDAATGDIAYCLNHPMDYPVGTQTYYSLDPTTMFSSATMKGLYTILSHGYPNTTGGLPDDMARYATSNAVRAWLAESQGIGYNYMNVSNGLIRAKSGSPWAYDWMLGLLNLARAGNANYLDWSGREVATSPSTVKLSLQSGSLVGTCTVDSPTGTYTIDNSKLPNGVTITGFTGNDNDTLTITAPIDIGSGDITISNVLRGTSKLSTSNVYWFETSGGYQPMVCVDFSKLRTVIYSDLTVNSKVGGYIQVIKRDDETSRYLQGAVFGIYKPDGTQVDTIVTNINGTEKSKFLDSGEYYIQEKTPPTGYIANDAKHSVSVAINGQTHVVWIKNSKIKGYVQLQKVGESDNPLKDAVYELYRNDNTYIEDLLTDANGTATSSLIPYGSYYLKEKTAPAMYNLNTEKHEFNIIVNNETVEVKVSNTLYRGNVKIVKIDESGDPIQGVVFGVCDTSDMLLEEVSTDTNGEATSSDFVYGDYYVKEISTLPQYLISYDKVPFSITQNGVTVTLNVINMFKRGYINIVKTGEQNDSMPLGYPLVDVVFQLFDDTDVLIETLTTGDDGQVKSSSLIYGDYYLREVSTLEQYNLISEKIPVEIRNDKLTVQVPVVNTLKRGNFRIVKVGEDNDPLEGVVFELYDSKDALIETLKTDENGMVGSSDIIYGDYYIKEISTLKPFNLLADTIPILIRENGVTIMLDVENTLIRGNVKVVKTNVQDSKPIENVYFWLLTSDGERIEELTTDANGEFTTSELLFGKYYLQEKSVPEGFVLDDKLHEFDITKDGVVEMSIKNQPIVGSVEVYFRHVDHNHELARAFAFTDWVGEPYMAWVNGYGLDKKPLDGYLYVKADYPTDPNLVDGKLTITYWYDEKINGTWNDVVIPKTGDKYPVFSYLTSAICLLLGAVYISIYLKKKNT
jgi:uncharacterized surface anchored protein